MRTSKTYLFLGAFVPVLFALFNLIAVPFLHADNVEARVALCVVAFAAAPIAFLILHGGRSRMGFLPFLIMGLLLGIIIAHLATYDFSVGENRLLIFRGFLAATIVWAASWGVIARRAATSKSVAIN